MRFAPSTEDNGPITKTALLGRRAAAVIVDGLIVGFAVAPILMVGEGAELFSQVCEVPWSLRSMLLAGTVGVVPFALYEGAFLHVMGSTLGKRLLSVRVVNHDGAILHARRAWLRPIVRAVLRLISPIDYAAALARHDCGCLHDVLSKTRVVYVERVQPTRHDQHETQRLSEPQQWWFWVRWAALSVIGWTAGVLLLDEVTTDDFSASVRNGLLLLACTGLGTGAVQALLLRRHVPRSWLWAPLTIVGSVIGAVVFERVEVHLDSVSLAASLGVAWIPEIGAGLALNWISGWCTRFSFGNQTISDVAWVSASLTAAGLFGAILGLTQWLALRQSVARAAWWVVANVAVMAFIQVLTSEPPSRQRMLGIWLGIVLVGFQIFVLRWRILGWSSLVAAATMLSAYALGANEGDFTYAAVTSLVTGLVMTAFVSQRQRARQ